MPNTMHWGFIVALLLAIATTARASDETAIVKAATRLLDEISSDPKCGIPAKFLQEAKGILIMPHIVENQLVVGRKIGHGVFLSRNDKGEWGNPEIAVLGRLSAGAEVGHVVKDMVLIYRTQRAADKQGASSFAVGLASRFHARTRSPGKFVGPEPESVTKQEVLTYERDRGFGIGAAIFGEFQLNEDHADEPRVPKPKPTSAQPSTDPKTSSKPVEVSPEVARLKTVLAALTSPPVQVADKPVKDAQVKTASGAKSASVLPDSNRPVK